MAELTKMNDLLEKTKALEAKHRKPAKLPEAPREWAERILAGTYKLEDVPEHFRGIVQDHIDTHRMHVQAAAERILALPNGKVRLAAFQALPEALRPFVRDRVHEIRKDHSSAGG